VSSHDLTAARRPADLTRAAFLRRAAALGLSASVLPVIAACGGDDEPSGGASSKGTTLEDLGTLGGAVQILTYAGYEGGDAIKPWLKETGVSQDVTPINNQDDVTTKLRSPAGKTSDAAQLGVAQVEQYRQLGLAYPLQPDWFENLAAVESYFTDLTAADDGSLTAVPFVWGALGCNHDPRRIKTVESWQELADPKLRGRIAMIDDPVSTVQTGALALGIRTPSEMTRDQLEDVKAFLVKVKANARTVAAGYADIGDLIVAGDVWASFQGWNAVELFAAAKGGTVKTAYPKEGTVGFVDCYIVPKDADNKRSAVAFIDQMLSKEMQAYVGNDLASGVVRLDAAPMVKGAGAKVFDYDNLQQLFEEQFVFALDAPLESSGDIATHEDWVVAWEDVKAA
jgi:spermidine/putrescine transport system substrate-binding protein